KANLRRHRPTVKPPRSDTVSIRSCGSTSTRISLMKNDLLDRIPPSTLQSRHILMITHEIIGDDMQAVVITMAAGDEVRAEAGAMTYMTDGITMDARMEGGLLGGLKDRKSTRLNSSHVAISYAVFCLKKKK